MWSTQTYSKSVAGIDLTDTGNLVLFDEHKNAVWQSFDYPTDTLLPGQKLRVRQKLTPSDSVTNTSEDCLLSFSLGSDGLFAQMETNPPQVYYNLGINFPNTSDDSNYVEFTQGHFALFVNFARNGSLFSDFNSSAALQYLKFESDGHLRVYQQHRSEWIVAHDILTSSVGDCGYPMVCGNYGICTGHGTCSCADPYFKQRVDADPRAGRTETVPLSCEASQSQSFMEFFGIVYFTGREDTQDIRNADQESCMKACANNCSCQAAYYNVEIFGQNNSGPCYLVSQVFSITNLVGSSQRLMISIKVQNPPSGIQIPHIPSEPPVSPNINEPPVPSNINEPPVSPNSKMANAVPILIITPSLGSLLAFIFLVVIIKYRFRNKGVDPVEEDFLDQIPGATKRFTYNDLKAITEDFNKRLGEGGFSIVYQGTLANGTIVAVKHLNGLC
ncbi:hypothetical protein NL676_021237 [Syzygium grande]|nr:hypothetical protein NL676_021237 [Syzygium grande]